MLQPVYGVRNRGKSRPSILDTAMSESPATRTVEVFTADCPLCNDVLDTVRRIACDSCDVQVVPLQDEAGARRAEEVGVESVPAVVVNGALASCCQDRGVQEEALRDAGIGTPV